MIRSEKYIAGIAGCPYKPIEHPDVDHIKVCSSHLQNPKLLFLDLLGGYQNQRTF